MSKRKGTMTGFTIVSSSSVSRGCCLNSALSNVPKPQFYKNKNTARTTGPYRLRPLGEQHRQGSAPRAAAPRPGRVQDAGPAQPGLPSVAEGGEVGDGAADGPFEGAAAGGRVVERDRYGGGAALGPDGGDGGEDLVVDLCAVAGAESTGLSRGRVGEGCW